MTDSKPSTKQMKIKKFRKYHHIFQGAYGLQPWWCVRCGAECEVIHHVDRDRNNNEIENLQPLCSDCHRFVHRGRTHPPGTGEKIAATKRGKPRSEETKNKISEALKGKPATKSGAARKGKKLGSSQVRSDAIKKWWAERKSN